MRDITGASRIRVVAGVIGLAMTLGLTLAGCGGPGPQATVPTATPTLIPIPTLAPNPWNQVSDISSVASIAPARYKTQYEAFSGVTSKTSPPAFYIRRSDDFGKTFHDVTAPAIPGGANPTNVTYISGEESPANPSVYFLTVQTQADCAQYTLCQFQYVTTDGGASWTPLALPVHGVLGVENASDTGTLAQGQRLYGVVTDVILASSGVVPPGRLVVSNDGGVTWSVADAAIFAASQWIYNFAPALGGATVYALAGQNFGTGLTEQTPTLAVWRSDDAGATWTNEGPLPGVYAAGALAATDPASGQSILYVEVVDAKRDLHLEASRDGGATWPATYDFHSGSDQGHSNGMSGFVTALPDGSALLVGDNLFLLAWSPGRTPPHTLLPPPPGLGFVQSEITQPVGAGQIRLWISSADSNGKVTYAYVTVPG